MKKIIFGALFLAATFGFSQRDYSRYYNSWRLGLNIGGMWESSDLSTNNAGLAGGFTLEKGFCENKTNFFSFAIRGRALFGSAYGYDSKRNYNLRSNPALNGTYNPQVNYADSIGGVKNYIYNNYKTTISEGALELQISFNRLRERTHVILNLWGGVGFSVYRVKTNLLDANNAVYNFVKLDSTNAGSGINPILAQQGILDKTYESYAYGSNSKNILTFSPSAGIGLGYQFGPGFSILFEYKVTFPQGLNADLLDGYTGVNNHWLAKNNDFYHYAGVNFLFTLGRGHNTKESTHTNVNNYNTATTNTYVNVYNQQQNNQFIETNNYNNVYGMHPEKPLVDITNPSYSPFSTYTNEFNVTARVYNVASRNQISVTLNGAYVTNFTFNNGYLSFPANLLSGNNNVIISASNRAGNDSKSAVLYYTGNPPVITITNPATNPFTSTSQVLNIVADILNITSSTEISVKLNGNYFNNFSFNTLTTEFDSQLQLNNGTNNFEITATNTFGSDYKHIIINYTAPVTAVTGSAGKGVSVKITDPNVNPLTINTSNYPVTAKVTGVTSPSQVTVTVNGVNSFFNFNNGTVTFNPNYNQGSNTIIVSAKNYVSSDSRQTGIIYQVDKKYLPPSVIILSPVISPYASTNANYTFRAQTTNISNTSQLEVKFNGSIINNYSFDINTGVIEFNGSLLSFANNTFEVKATNTDGIADASATVKHEDVDQGDLDQKTIVICHKNADGSSQTITIRQSQWPQHAAHGDVMGACPPEQQITICHIPPGNPNNPQTIVIPESAWPSHAAHGDYKGSCVVTNTVGGIDRDITICHIPPGNPGNPQTITIKESAWPSHAAHGDYKGVCVVTGTIGGIDRDITICHIPPGNPANRQTITIKESAWPSHQAHGDYKGDCVATATIGGPQTGQGNADITICHTLPGGGHQTITIKELDWPSHEAHGDYKGICVAANNMGGPQAGGGTDRDITICHIPPGNPNNPQTITIKESAWPSHQAHGDSQGECPPQKHNEVQMYGPQKPENTNQNPVRPIPFNVQQPPQRQQIQQPQQQQLQKQQTMPGGEIKTGRPR